MAEKRFFDMTKLIVQIMCVTVVQWSRSCLHVQTTATLFSVCLYRFVFFLFFVFILSFLLAIFFFILIADPPGYALGSMYILSSSPEFYFGKGSSKALDMHIGHACDQVKTISCQDMSLL